MTFMDYLQLRNSTDENLIEYLLARQIRGEVYTPAKIRINANRDMSQTYERLDDDENS